MITDGDRVVVDKKLVAAVRYHAGAVFPCFQGELILAALDPSRSIWLEIHRDPSESIGIHRDPSGDGRTMASASVAAFACVPFSWLLGAHPRSCCVWVHRRWCFPTSLITISTRLGQEWRCGGPGKGRGTLPTCATRDASHTKSHILLRKSILRDLTYKPLLGGELNRARHAI